MQIRVYVSIHRCACLKLLHSDKQQVARFFFPVKSHYTTAEEEEAPGREVIVSHLKWHLFSERCRLLIGPHRPCDVFVATVPRFSLVEWKVEPVLIFKSSRSSSFVSYFFVLCFFSIAGGTVNSQYGGRCFDSPCMFSLFLHSGPIPNSTRSSRPSRPIHSTSV